jgi:hypothetical protein
VALQYACELLVDVADLVCDCDLPDDEDVIDRVLDGASDFLSYLAGMPLGRCTAVYRPCHDRRWGHCLPCGCCGLIGIHLPGAAPSVTEVKIDGAIIPTSQYVTMVEPMAHRYVLERVDSNGDSIWWPRSQKITRAPTATDTFQITVESGLEVDAMMSTAAGEIACDTFKWILNQDSLLPAGVASVIAGGVVASYFRFSDPTDQTTLNLAGLTMVQRFLQTVPGKPSGAEIISPELDDGWTLYQRL